MTQSLEPRCAVEHETFAVTRVYEADRSRVFAAWADPEARSRWAPPSKGQAIEYLETDFRTGGRDVSNCGAAGDLSIRVESHYLDIVPDRRIVFSEVVASGGARLSVSLITVEFETDGDRTRLTLTDQIAALDGSGMVSGSKAGFAAALDNLAEDLRRSDRTEEHG